MAVERTAWELIRARQPARRFGHRSWTLVSVLVFSSGLLLGWLLFSPERAAVVTVPEVAVENFPPGGARVEATPPQIRPVTPSTPQARKTRQIPPTGGAVAAREDLAATTIQAPPETPPEQPRIDDWGIPVITFDAPNTDLDRGVRSQPRKAQVWSIIVTEQRRVIILLRGSLGPGAAPVGFEMELEFDPTRRPAAVDGVVRYGGTVGAAAFANRLNGSVSESELSLREVTTLWSKPSVVPTVGRSFTFSLPDLYGQLQVAGVSIIFKEPHRPRSDCRHTSGRRNDDGVAVVLRRAQASSNCRLFITPS